MGSGDYAASAHALAHIAVLFDSFTGHSDSICILEDVQIRLEVEREILPYRIRLLRHLCQYPALGPAALQKRLTELSKWHVRE